MKKRSIVPFIVKRYLKFDKTQPFISISAILAFVGVSVGVMVLIVAMAIMNGFDKEFEKKLFTMNNPITLFPKIHNAIDDALINELENRLPHLIYSPFLRSQAIIKSGDFMEGVVVFGVDMQKEMEINSIIKDAMSGVDIDKFEILIGEGLKNDNNLPKGSKPTLIFTDLNPNGLTLMPTIKRFEVVSSFKSGLIAYDKSYIYTTIPSLRAIKKRGGDYYDGVHIFSQKPFEDIEKLKEILPHSVVAIGWWEQNGNFFAALQMEKRALFIVLMLIILIASLNIISSLLMTVMNRRREIALLLTMGASQKEIKRIFFYLGNIIGVGGVLFGVILSAISLYFLSSFPIISLPMDVYGTEKLPLDLSIFDLSVILVGALSIVVLSSYYPAKKATEIDALNVLRNE